MFGPSLKSVPGCFVSIVPILIGEPVAATPGFGPHFDVSTEPEFEPELPVLAALDEAELEVELPPPPAELLELVLPQPTAPSAKTATSDTAIARHRHRAS
jgi:hypothetical protein